MSETGSLAQEVREQIDKAGTADVVIGLPGYKSSADAAWATDFAGKTEWRILIAYPNVGDTLDPQQVPGAAMVRYPVSVSDRYLNAAASVYGSYYEVLQISQRVGAKSCCIWNSNPQLLSVERVEQMLRPVSEQNFDLVVARYVESKLSGLVTSSIIRPVTRALYGKGIRFPMAIDLGFSAPLVERLLKPDQSTRRPRAFQWIATEAISAGLRVCQASLPIEPPVPQDSTDLSSLLAMVLGRLFADLERNATFWQRLNGSQNVMTFGELPPKEEEEAPVDVHRMIETFQLAYRNLTQIWGLALTPATMVELKKLTRAASNEFRMPDDLWVRVVYDFALAHRQRSINREHLLGAMTPLYLAWVASYTLEMRNLAGGGFLDRLQQLGLAYEKQKPYLLSRWRWPDRFNP
jgi:hypothetical protein